MDKRKKIYLGIGVCLMGISNYFSYLMGYSNGQDYQKNKEPDRALGATFFPDGTPETQTPNTLRVHTSGSSLVDVFGKKILDGNKGLIDFRLPGGTGFRVGKGNSVVSGDNDNLEWKSQTP